MSPRTLLALALLVAVLAGFIWFVERDLPSTDERRQEAARILPIDEADVRALVIETDGQVARLELETEEVLPEDEASLGGEWRLVEPLTGRVDGDDVTSAIAVLLAVEYSRRLDDVSWDEVGLTEPRLVVAVETENETVELAVGAGVPASDDVIVAVDGTRVYVVPGDFVAPFLRQPGEWRDRRLFPVSERQIERVAVTGSGLDLVLERGDGGFEIVRPLTDEADTERADELLQELVALEVDEFLDGVDPGTLGESDTARFEVTTSSRDEPLVVLIATADGSGEKQRAVAEGQVVAVTTGLIDIVSDPPGRWRSRSWTRLEAFEVDRVDVERGDRRVELVREGGDWVGDAGTYSYAAVREFLDAITGVEGVPLPEARADDELEKTLTLGLSSSARSEILELRRDGDAVRAGKVGRAVELELSPESAAQVTSAVERLLEAVVADDTGDSA